MQHEEKLPLIEFSCGEEKEARVTKMGRIHQIIKNQGVIGFPTDTVYGLGCSPFSESAIQKLLQIKHRLPAKGLAILASDLQSVQKYVRLEKQMLGFAHQVWPGKVTLIFLLRPEISPSIHPLVTGYRETIAIRIPGLPFTRKLIRVCGGILVGTSANVSGSDPLLTAKTVVKTFGSQVDGLVFCKRENGEYEMGKGKASTIIDLAVSPPVIRRKSADISVSLINMVSNLYQEI